MLDIMVEIDRIARKHDIKYILDGGTLLGCIRHQGFIPWDDDMDIALTRKEYNKLKAVCRKELCPDYFWQDKSSDRNYPLEFAKVKNIHTLYVEEWYASIAMNHGIFIDIFPMDNTLGIIHRLQGYLVLFLQHIKYRKMGLREFNVRRLNALLNKPTMKIIIRLAPMNLLNFLITLFSTLFNIIPAHFVNKFSNWGVYKPVFNKTMFTDTIEGDFKGHKFFIPRNYHQYLTCQYGDYMKLPPMDNRKSVHNIVKCELDKA